MIRIVPQYKADIRSLVWLNDPVFLIKHPYVKPNPQQTTLHIEKQKKETNRKTKF